MDSPAAMRNIVVAVEDDHSLEVIEKWLEHFSAPPAKFFIINVIAPAEEIQKWPNQHYRTDAEVLLQKCAALFKQGFPDSEVECILAEGYAEHEIVELAQNCSATCVVVAGRGLGKVSRFLFGSISTEVVLRAPCTVIVLKRDSGGNRPRHHCVQSACLSNGEKR